MAYTTPNTGIMRPWNYTNNRYVHRRAVLTVGGSGKGGGTTGTASDVVSIPCPGRLIAIAYGLQGAGAIPENGVTGGTLVVKAETTAGAQILSHASLNTEQLTPAPIGTTSLDEGRAATAATDGFSGGFPVRSGVHLAVSSGTDTEIIVVDLYFRLCTYVKLDLVAQSGADGTGAVSRTIPLGNAGVLAAVAIDFQNTPATADVTIKADATGGAVLFTSTDSLTDLAPTCLGSPGLDEAKNATAATDGTECGNAFRGGLFVSVAQTDIFTGGDEHTIVEMWIDD